MRIFCPGCRCLRNFCSACRCLRMIRSGCRFPGCFCSACRCRPGSSVVLCFLGCPGGRCRLLRCPGLRNVLCFSLFCFRSGCSRSCFRRSCLYFRINAFCRGGLLNRCGSRFGSGSLCCRLRLCFRRLQCFGTLYLLSLCTLSRRPLSTLGRPCCRTLTLRRRTRSRRSSSRSRALRAPAGLPGFSASGLFPCSRPLIRLHHTGFTVLRTKDRDQVLLFRLWRSPLLIRFILVHVFRFICHMYNSFFLIQFRIAVNAASAFRI